MGSHDGAIMPTWTQKKFGGLASKLAPYLGEEFDAQEALNVDTRYGTLRKAPGYLRVNATRYASAAVLGLHEFDTKAAAYKRVAKVGSSFFSLTSMALGAGTSSSIKSGATNSTKPSKAMTFRDALLIADYDEFHIWEGTNFGPATRAAPSAPTVVAGTGSLPNGTYLYRVVPYSSVLLEEGPAS